MCGGTIASRDALNAGAGLSPRVRGNPASPSNPSNWIRVYPRVCGGTLNTRTPVSSLQGLSPRVRGNRRPVENGCPFHGSIPACAGEPSAPRLELRFFRVYPRVCGGTSASSPARRSSLGLSPRVRGNPPVDVLEPVRPGSIPACAGEPEAPPPEPGLFPVYPRVCGGTTARDAVRIQVEGLSPRVRGNPDGESLATALIGSIPACAGEPRRWRVPGRPHRVYPRVCGGTPSATYPFQP